jgi:hypothetical protein
MQAKPKHPGGRPAGSPNKPIETRIEIVLKAAALACAKRVREGDHDQNDVIYLKAYLDKLAKEAKNAPAQQVAEFSFDDDDGGDE